MARVLVIEDNPDNRDLMVYLLQAFGHDVATAADGEGALTMLAAAWFDVIVCDVHLPKIDGREVVAVIRSDPRQRQTPVIAVTALAMVGDSDRLLEAGFDGYIPKPIEPREFVGQIERFLAGGRSPAAPADPP